MFSSRALRRLKRILDQRGHRVQGWPNRIPGDEHDNVEYTLPHDE